MWGDNPAASVHPLVVRRSATTSTLVDHRPADRSTSYHATAGMASNLLVPPPVNPNRLTIAASRASDVYWASHSMSTVVTDIHTFLRIVAMASTS